MILIADSGSTKTDWCIVDKGKAVQSVATQGITPIHQTAEQISDILRNELMPHVPVNIVFEMIRFYGSGCREDVVPQLKAVIEQVIPCKALEISSDLLGAARGLLGRKPGIACILGTGANSCLYDGEKIIDNTPALGYILGDEGSGAVLGRNFVNALFKHRLPEELKEEFCRETNLDLDTIINKVYRQPLANRFLASLSLFILRHAEVEELRQLVIDNFDDFIDKNIKPYNRSDLSINAIGSLAFYFQKELVEASKVRGYSVGKIERSPMQGLIDYECQS